MGLGIEIKNLMEEKGWGQAELAQLLDISLKHVNEILNGKRNISFTLDQLLCQIFDKEPLYFIKLDLENRKKNTNTDSQISIRKKIYEFLPVLEMQKRGWIKKTSSTEDLKKEVLKFLNLTELNFEQFSSMEQPVYRRSEVKSFNLNYTFIWYYKAKKNQPKQKLVNYEQKNLENLLSNLEPYLYSENSIQINHFLEELQKVGVHFFILPALKKTYINGAAFKVNNVPSLVITLRYNRLDHFWFTLLHELGHILLHFKHLDSGFIDLEDDEIKDKEKEADLFAEKYLKVAQIEEFVQSYTYIPDSLLSKMSKDLKLPIAIIKGILAKKGRINYSRIHSGNVDVNKLISPKWKYI